MREGKSKKIVYYTFSVIVILGMLIVGFAGGAYSKEKIKISMWFHDPLYVKFFTLTSSEYAKMHPEYDFEFDIKQIPSGEIATKIIATIVAGSGTPDIMGNMLFDMPRFLKGGLAEAGLVDLAPLIGDLYDDFFETSWSPFKWEGKIYGVESALCPVVYYYRKDLFDEAGISPPFNTWADFTNAGKKLKTKGRYMNCLLTVDFHDPYEVFLLLRGGTIFDEKGVVRIDSHAARETLQFYIDQLMKDQVALGFADWASHISGLKEGVVAGAVGADWYSDFVVKAAVPEQSGKWRVTLLPAFEPGGTRGTRWGGTGMGIAKQSKHKEIAWEILKYSYLTYENQVRRYTEIHYFPTMKKAVQDPKVIESPDPFFGGQKVGAVFATASTEIPMWYTSPWKAEAYTILDKEALTPAIQGKKSIEQAIRDAAEVIKKLVGE